MTDDAARPCPHCDGTLKELLGALLDCDEFMAPQIDALEAENAKLRAIADAARSWRKRERDILETPYAKGTVGHYQIERDAALLLDVFLKALAADGSMREDQETEK